MFTLSHVADFNRRYTGEPLTFYSRLDVNEPIAGVTLQISVPGELQIDSYASPFDDAGSSNGRAPLLPELVHDPNISYVVWRIERTLAPGVYEFQVDTTVEVMNLDVTVESHALARAEVDDTTVRDEEMVSVLISAKSDLLKYLPALYEKDEMMGRFLMLFESFLSPIEGQIDEIPLYFDPSIAPADLLPWLASWVNLALDERWPEERRRTLIKEAFRLYRKRGTKQGLRRYLEIYTGRTPDIVEHRANNFRLGAESRLGPGIALGRQNVPHTFTVTMRLPPVEADTDEERKRKATERRRTIESIIEAEKPAHTTYTLHIERKRTAT